MAVAKDKPFENDRNEEYTGCTAEEAYEMAQHIVYSLYEGKLPSVWDVFS